MKRALGTFKRMFFPLYFWYFILSILIVVLAFVSLLPTIVSLIQSGTLGPEISGLPGFPGIPGVPSGPEVPSLPGVPTPPFSGSYPNPNPPTPPGNTFVPGGPGTFMDEVAPFLSLAPKFLLSFIGLILLSWISSSAFMTGMFHLTKKAYTTQAKVKDFHLKGFSRVLGWYGILTLLGVILIGIGGFIAFFLRNIDYAIPLFVGLYFLLLMAVGLFFAPWLSTSVFYMLNHRELSFRKSFRESWNLYLRHKWSFWSYLLTIIVLQLIIAFIDRNSPNLGLIVSIIISPFTTILPIVWVLTHEDDENPPMVVEPQVSYTSTPVTAPIAAYPQEVAPQEPTPTESSLQHAAPQSTPQESPQKSPPQTPNPEPPKDYPPVYTPEITTEENSPINYCPTCGKNVRPGASYCSQCGTKL
jgi:hypothetical protein